MTDFHLGHRQYGSIEREEDFYKQLQKCCDEINKHECDMVIIAGDIFDKPNPSPQAIHEYSNAIGKLEADVILAIKGNHTMLLRENHYSVDQLIADDNDISGYYLLDDESWNSGVYALGQEDSLYTKWQKEKIYVDGITYRSNTKIDDFIEKQNLLSAIEAENESFRILIVHQSFSEFCGFTGEKLSINDINTDPYDLIICGHIHSRLYFELDDGTMFLQPGSIERLNTTEARDEIENGKGIWIVDTKNNDISFYPVKVQRKFFLGHINIEKEEDIGTYEKEIVDAIKDLDELPVISYEYHDFVGKGESIRSSISNISQYALINNSNINDETIIDTSINVSDDGIPTIPQLIQNINANLSEEEKIFAVDLHDALNNKNDVHELLEDFRKKHFSNSVKKEQKKNFYDDELDALSCFFESL